MEVQFISYHSSPLLTSVPKVMPQRAKQLLIEPTTFVVVTTDTAKPFVDKQNGTGGKVLHKPMTRVLLTEIMAEEEG